MKSLPELFKEVDQTLEHAQPAVFHSTRTRLEAARAALRDIAKRWPGTYEEDAVGYTLDHSDGIAILAALEEK